MLQQDMLRHVEEHDIPIQVCRTPTSWRVMAEAIVGKDGCAYILGISRKGLTTYFTVQIDDNSVMR